MAEDIKHSTAGHSSEQLYLRERPFEGDCLSFMDTLFAKESKKQLTKKK